MPAHGFLSRNAACNVAGYVVSVVVGFLIAPITIHSLGDARYGAWSLVSELIGYYGLLDLGVRGAVTYYVACYTGRNQDENIRETVTSAVWLLSGCGLLAFAIGAALTFAFPYLFRTEGVDLAEAQRALLIMSGLIGLSLPMNAFSGALIGKQRFDITSACEVITRILTAVGVYASLKAGGGLVDLALVHVAGRVVYWTLSVVACRSVLGGVFLAPAWFRLGRVRALTAYGFRNAVGNVALLIIYNVDLTVVGMFAGIEKVTYYAIGGTLVSYAWALCSAMANVFTPRFTQLAASGLNEEVHELYFLGTRLIGMVVTALLSGILVFGNDFIALWLGPAYVTGPWTDRSDVIMVLLVLANLPRMLQSLSSQLLFATAHVRLMMWLNVGEAIANLGLSVLLVRWYGPAGVAMGTLFPLLASHGLLMPMFISRLLNVSVWEMFRRGLAVPLYTGTVMATIGMASRYVAPARSWMVFSVDVAVTIAAGIGVCAWIGLRREERTELWQRFGGGSLRQIANTPR